MSREYNTIKDNCRKGLLKYLSKAISIIPAIEKPFILDIGCGTGVPTIAIAERFNGTIIAVDSDIESINILKEKVNELNLSNRITLFNSSFFDIELVDNQFDIVIAEGFLNVVGFQKGFLKVKNILKRGGFFIIHDEFHNHIKKNKFIEENNCTVLYSFRIDEQIWWNDYYKCLEKEISSSSNKEFLNLFKSDLYEIELFKQDSSQFESIYYVIEKN